jgi:hypothetical protein
VTAWSRRDTVGALSIGSEIAGWCLVFAASAFAYRMLGWSLVALGIVPWCLPAIRATITEERRRHEERE